MADLAVLTFRPLEAWTEEHTTRRANSGQFRASYDDTLDLLAFEAGMIGGDLVVIQLAINEYDLRIDGTPKVRARPTHPGVAVSFDSRHGPLRYATDRFDAWVGNLRAIALGLADLRRLERYGITGRGEQYLGFKQIAPPAPTANRQMTRTDAARFIAEQAGSPADWLAVLKDLAGMRRDAYRLAAKRLHPDVTGGDRELFDRLQAARDLLTAGGGR